MVLWCMSFKSQLCWDSLSTEIIKHRKQRPGPCQTQASNSCDPSAFTLHYLDRKIFPAWRRLTCMVGKCVFLIQVKGPFNTAANSTNQNLRRMIKTLATDTEDSPVWPLPLVTRSKNRAAISVPNKQKWLSCSPRLLPPPCYSPLPVNGYLKGMSEIRE